MQLVRGSTRIALLDSPNDWVSVEEANACLKQNSEDHNYPPQWTVDQNDYSMTGMSVH